MSENKQLVQILERVDYLEVKVAYQDDTIEQLNQIVISQQSDLQSLKDQMSMLKEKLKSLQVSDLPSSDEIELPPHY